MTEELRATKKTLEVIVGRAKGRPMLSWIGKKPLGRVTAFPAQHIESFSAKKDLNPLPPNAADWSKWPKELPRGGLLYHGDNKEVLAHLLANGFRGQVKLIYIDPPFDSGAEYVRKVQLRGPKGVVKIEGEDYALGEQVQYTDIWSNDNYLQFMYERLLMLRELLHENGVIILHCDCKKVHHLRCLMDEVFGTESFLNEVIWDYRRWPSSAPEFQKMHDNLLIYCATKGTHTFNRQFGERTESTERRWKGKAIVASHSEDGERVPSDYGAEDSAGSPLSDVWYVPIVAPSGNERRNYPTQKPEALLEKLFVSLTNPGDLVLDCFLGSGTTATVAQKMGLRWIGCDINKGAIQTSIKGLQAVMRAQAQTIASAQGELVINAESPAVPCQLGFTTWRVNDYDLHIQHNEAVELACEHLGISRNRTDPFFDGTRGKMLAKIIPLNHPLTPLDLEAVRAELKNRPDEERDLLIVSLGQEHKAREWVERYNHNRPVNKIHLLELRSDRKAGGFIKHEPMSARVSVHRDSNKLFIEIDDVISPSIIARLDLQEGIFRAQIPDWRAVVDCIMIDADHDNAVFNVTLIDVPERKQELVKGRYEMTAPQTGAVIAIKIIDMLGEEFVITVKV